MAVKTIEQILKDTKIYQIHRPKCVTSYADISLQQALDLMHKEKSGYVVITDRDQKIIGLFTERCVLMNVLGRGVPLSEPMQNYMIANPKTLSQNDTVGQAIDTMRSENVRHVPLADKEGRMTGVLSIRTVVNFLSELFPTEVFNLPPKPDQMPETVEGG